MAGSDEHYKLLEFQPKTCYLPEQSAIHRSSSAGGRLQNSSVGQYSQPIPRHPQPRISEEEVRSVHHYSSDMHDPRRSYGYEMDSYKQPLVPPSSQPQPPLFVLMPANQAAMNNNYYPGRMNGVGGGGGDAAMMSYGSGGMDTLARRRRLSYRDMEYADPYSRKKKSCCSCWRCAIASIIILAILGVGAAIAGVVFIKLIDDSIVPATVVTTTTVSPPGSIAIVLPPQQRDVTAFDIEPPSNTSGETQSEVRDAPTLPEPGRVVVTAAGKDTPPTAIVTGIDSSGVIVEVPRDEKTNATVQFDVARVPVGSGVNVFVPPGKTAEINITTGGAAGQPPPSHFGRPTSLIPVVPVGVLVASDRPVDTVVRQQPARLTTLTDAPVTSSSEGVGPAPSFPSTTLDSSTTTPMPFIPDTTLIPEHHSGTTSLTTFVNPPGVTGPVLVSGQWIATTIPGPTITLGPQDPSNPAMINPLATPLPIRTQADIDLFVPDATGPGPAFVAQVPVRSFTQSDSFRNAADAKALMDRDRLLRMRQPLVSSTNVPIAIVNVIAPAPETTTMTVLLETSLTTLPSSNSTSSQRKKKRGVKH